MKMKRILTGMLGAAILAAGVNLLSVQAAENLLQEFEATVERIAQFPYANALYRTDRPIDHEIRKVAVKNYILYYTVFQDHVEIFRFIHGRRNQVWDAIDPDGA